MRRREFISLTAAFTAAWPRTLRAQQATKVWRIGVLETTPATLNTANFDAFRQGLRELSYVEGQNLVIEYRSADGRVERFPDLAAELVALNADLILTRGTAAALAAKAATKTIPIVLAGLGDPVGNGIIGSLARPGGNITGLSASTTELQAKRLELLKDTIPGATRVAALFNMGDANDKLNWEQTEKAAGLLGVRVQLLDARNADDLKRAFDAAREHGANGLIVSLHALMSTNRRVIADLAAAQRLPAIYASREFIQAGGLLSYGVNYPDLYRRAAGFADRIFKGTKPADLPVEQPTKFELVINAKTAKALGLTVPPTLLARADEVIE